jgi:cytochrome c556
MFTKRWAASAGCALLLGLPVALSAQTQNAAGAPAVPGRQAIDDRKALFTLIGGSFRPIAEILRGNATYDSVDVGKYTTRVTLLSTFVSDAFPDASKLGDTQAKAEIWSNRADFDRRVKEFHDHALALAQVAARLEGNSDAFKAAARTVTQDCKGCHDQYRSK